MFKKIVLSMMLVVCCVAHTGSVSTESKESLEIALNNPKALVKAIKAILDNERIFNNKKGVLSINFKETLKTFPKNNTTIEQLALFCKIGGIKSSLTQDESEDFVKIANAIIGDELLPGKKVVTESPNGVRQEVVINNRKRTPYMEKKEVIKSIKKLGSMFNGFITPLKSQEEKKSETNVKTMVLETTPSLNTIVMNVLSTSPVTEIKKPITEELLVPVVDNKESSVISTPSKQNTDWLQNGEDNDEDTNEITSYDGSGISVSDLKEDKSPKSELVKSKLVDTETQTDLEQEELAQQKEVVAKLKEELEKTKKGFDEALNGSIISHDNYVNLKQQFEKITNFSKRDQEILKQEKDLLIKKVYFNKLQEIKDLEVLAAQEKSLNDTLLQVNELAEKVKKLPSQSLQDSTKKIELEKTIIDQRRITQQSTEKLSKIFNKEDAVIIEGLKNSLTAQERETSKTRWAAIATFLPAAFALVFNQNATKGPWCLLNFSSFNAQLGVASLCLGCGALMYYGPALYNKFFVKRNEQAHIV